MKTRGEERPGLDDIGSYIKSRSLGGTIVREVLDDKGYDVWTIPQEASVYEVLEIMLNHNVGSLVVLDADKRVVGMISERDYARKVSVSGKRSRETAVREIMSAPVQTVSPEDSVAECMSLMTVGHVRHLPVCAGDKLVGIISIGDLVKTYIASQERLIEHYEKYIRGSYPE